MGPDTMVRIDPAKHARATPACCETGMFGPDVAAKSLHEDAWDFAKALAQCAAHRSGIVGADDVVRNDGGRMAGVMPEHAEHLPVVCLAQQHDRRALVPGT